MRCASRACASPSGTTWSSTASTSRSPSTRSCASSGRPGRARARSCAASTAGAHRRREDRGPGRRDHGQGRRRGPHPAGHRHRVPGIQPLPAHDRAPETSRSHPSRSSTCPGRMRRRARTSCCDASAHGQARCRPRPALGRPAAARGHRPGPRHGASIRCSTRSPRRSTRCSWPRCCRSSGTRARGHDQVIATHEMGFARDIANRVAFLDGGRILEEGPPAEMFSAPREPETRRFLDRVIEAGRL